jgi:hypothetical protein
MAGDENRDQRRSHVFRRFSIRDSSQAGIAASVKSFTATDIGR